MIDITYSFKFEDNSTRNFKLQLNSETLQLVHQQKGPLPAWTALENHQCSNCPLKKETDPQCPVALNMTEIIDFFRESISFHEVDLTITTNERTYFKHLPLQKGLSSLIGIYMVASGCPILDKLKPMVRNHLPFASLQETQYRVLSMFLMAQFFQRRNGKRTRDNLEELSKIYKEIQTVNKGFCNRMKSIEGKDAVPNAVVILNSLADTIVFLLDEKALKNMEKMFSAYLT